MGPVEAVVRSTQWSTSEGDLSRRHPVTGQVTHSRAFQNPKSFHDFVTGLIDLRPLTELRPHDAGEDELSIGDR